MMVVNFLNNSALIGGVVLETGTAQRVGRIQAFEQPFLGTVDGVDVSGRLVGINANGQGAVVGALADIENAQNFGPIFDAVIDSFVFTADEE